MFDEGEWLLFAEERSGVNKSHGIQLMAAAHEDFLRPCTTAPALSKRPSQLESEGRFAFL